MQKWTVVGGGRRACCISGCPDREAWSAYVSHSAARELVAGGLIREGMMAATEGREANAGDGGRVRASAADIYERVTREAGEELDRPVAALLFSGLCAGASVGFGALASAAATVGLAGADGARLVGAVVFPVGFIIVIIGRAQLFTENTLYPVALVLDERRHLLATLRL
jgi:hypothetical protein